MSFINVISTVYENVVKMTTYRNIVLDTPMIPAEEVATKISSAKYITMIGKNRRDQYSIIIIIGDNDNSTKVDSFRTMMKNIYADFKKSYDEITDDLKIEFIIIGPTISKTIHKQVLPEGKKTRSKHDTINETYKNAHISLYTYDIFKIEVPLGPNCFPHIILSEEEKAEFLVRERLDVVNMPKILTTDPQCIWIGARKGDIVKILRRNPLSITEIHYRYVKA